LGTAERPDLSSGREGKVNGGIKETEGFQHHLLEWLVSQVMFRE